MNTKPKVFLTRHIPESGLRLLKEHTDLSIFPHDRPITKDEILEVIQDAEGLLCLLTDPIDTEIINHGKRLKVISNYAVGYNNIDIHTAKIRNIIVTNTPGVLTDATADIAFALMISAARRIAESDRWLRSHEFEGWAPMLFLGLDLVRKTLGIIGAGRIGKALAKRAVGAFDMKILYHDHQRDHEFEQQYGAEAVSKEILLRESDFISLHVPLTDETHHMIGENEINLMKPNAVLINTARGPIVDESTLIEALRQRKIFAAGFDVYENEPSIPDSLKQLDNVVILPHIGSASIETREKMAEMAAENLIDVLQGREPKYRVV